jgi:site-specific DNA recombinase
MQRNVADRRRDSQPRAAIYRRVSTERQADQGLSLEEQARLAVERCEREGWAFDVYEDAGWSGSRWDRPGLQQLLADIGRYDYLVVWKLDRLTRRTAHLADLLDRLQAEGVGVVSLTEPFDGSTPMGRAMVEIAGVFAQLERSHNAERVRASAVPRVKRRRKPYGGGRRMYGRDRAYTVVPREAEVVRRIVADTLRGLSELQIARALDAEGVPPPGGQRWHASVIGRMLRRPHLVGRVVAPDGEVVESDLEPILDEQTWNDLQAFLANRTRGRERRGRGPAYPFLLDDPLDAFCGDCGGRMVPRTEKHRADGTPVLRYVCARRKLDGPGACPRTPVDARTVDEVLFGWIERGHVDLRATRRAVKRAARAVVEDARRALRDAERAEMRRDADLAKIERDYLDGSLPAADYARLSARLAADGDAAAEETRRLRARVEELEAEGSLADTQTATVRYLAELRAAVAGFRAADSAETAAAYAAVRAALARIAEGVIIGDASRPQAVTAAVLDPANVEGDTAHGVVSAIATGQGATVLQVVPRRELARAAVVRHEGRDLPLLEAGAAPLYPPPDNSPFTSQKTSRRPRRTTRSSSFPPAQTFAASTR